MSSDKEIANAPPVDSSGENGRDRLQEAPEGASRSNIDVDMLTEAIKRVYEEVTEKEKKQKKEHKVKAKKRKAEENSEPSVPLPRPNACAVCKHRLDEPAGVAEPIPKRPRLQPPPNPNDSPLRIGPCGHIFHKVCINHWFSKTLLGARQKPSRTAACPVCSRFVRSASLYPIVLKFQAVKNVNKDKNKDTNKAESKKIAKLQKSVNQVQKDHSSLMNVLRAAATQRGGTASLVPANSDSDSDWSKYSDTDDEDEDKK